MSSLTMDPRQSLLNAIALRPLNWEICQAVNYAIWCCTEIDVSIHYNSNGFVKQAVVYVQQTPMADLDRALEWISYICSNSRLITRLKLNVEVRDTSVAEAIFDTLLRGKHVQLQELKLRRRYVGQQFTGLPRLIKQQAKSLKVIGKLGLGEAIQAFDERIHLERLSLINFDLIENGEMESEALGEKTRFAFRRLAGLMATFDHLSYSTYSGFDLTKNPQMHMLKMCEVKSIRLTQQSGLAIADPPMLRVLLPELRRIELIGSMEVKAQRLEVLFPKLESFHFQKQDLVTGGESSRRPSLVASTNRALETMNMAFPIAAAC